MDKQLQFVRIGENSRFGRTALDRVNAELHTKAALLYLRIAAELNKNMAAKRWEPEFALTFIRLEVALSTLTVRDRKVEL
jgi:hypothetical protein